MKALLIKPDHLGDFALTLPVLYEAVQEWGKESFMILASAPQKEWEQILPWMPRIHPFIHPRYQRNSISANSSWSIALAEGIFLRKERWDLSIELTSSRHDFLGKVIPWIAGAQKRFGQKGHWDFLLTEAQDQGRGHQKERMAQRFPKEWNITGNADPIDFIPSTLRWKSDPNAVHLFFPWAGTEAKLWTPDKWRKLQQQFPASSFLTPISLKSEAEKWQKEYLIPPSAFLYTHSILQTLQALSQSKALVTLDTGVAHFAWLTGTPLIQLFAATTDPERWKSPGVNTLLTHKPQCAPCKSEFCNQSSHLCMNAISVEQVIESLASL